MWAGDQKRVSPMYVPHGKAFGNYHTKAFTHTQLILFYQICHSKLSQQQWTGN